MIELWLMLGSKALSFPVGGLVVGANLAGCDAACKRSLAETLSRTSTASEGTLLTCLLRKHTRDRVISTVRKTNPKWEDNNKKLTGGWIRFDSRQSNHWSPGILLGTEHSTHGNPLGGKLQKKVRYGSNWVVGQSSLVGWLFLFVQLVSM